MTAKQMTSGAILPVFSVPWLLLRVPTASQRFIQEAGSELPARDQTTTGLQIIVLSIWWQEWWACLLWACIILGCVFGLYMSQIKRDFAEREAMRIKELYDLKSQHFAGIAHEFRTPLMLILGQADQCSQQLSVYGHEKQIEQLMSMKNNGQRLLELVNQILELEKLEGGTVALNWKHGDVILLLQVIAEGFQPLAKERGISLDFETDGTPLMMDHDPDKLFKIVTNLLSNALKFTPPHGRVVLAAQAVNGEFEMQVKDNGGGITPEELDQIFTRFYQANSNSGSLGTGIGLSLVKELVGLIGGHISVQSARGTGTTFTVRLPMRAEHARTNGNEGQNGHAVFENNSFLLPVGNGGTGFNGDEGSIAFENNDLPLLLIVEDNREVGRFLASILREEYQLAFAENGGQGISRALELTPDLIISDVMMPVMDGIKMLVALKKDQRTSHIPVILLTAKSSGKDRLDGLRRGADAYIGKPFQEEELLVRIQQLLSMRKILQKRYAGLEVQPEVRTADFNMAGEMDLPLEDDFMRRLLEVIKAHVSDPGFGTAELCNEMAMSPSQLHRKLSAVTDKTPVQLIRSMRMGRAKTLLMRQGLSISEIAYHSGFKDPAYFSRIFSKEFGVSPSDFKEMLG